MNTGLYLHIPFCDTKCDYCDFISFSNKQNLWKDYKDTLIKEISSFTPTTPIDTIYIGGGTPTVWPSSFLSQLLEALPTTLRGAEVTCEANPGTLTKKKIDVLTSGGVNRISMGLQAWQPHLLKAVGRQSDIKSFLTNFRDMRQAGLNNINVDIMFSLPGQSLKDWEETLYQVTALKPEHISAYALTLEEGSPLRVRNIDEIDEETDRLMYHRCKKILGDCGYIQYELSNFCKPGCESRHNVRYWLRKPYIGFGLGAHSFEGGVRWHNTTDMGQYLESQTKLGSTPIAKSDAMAEFMFLGLRTTKGVSAKAFAIEFDKPLREVYGYWVNRMKKEELLQEKDGFISLTDLGMDLANRVMAGFLE